jgi:hypothetical protein
LRYLLLALLLAACAKAKNEPKGAPVFDLAAKRDLYISLLPTVEDEDGFIEFDKCDSIHFSALTAIGAGRPFNISKVITDEGKLIRRPLRHGECYPKNSGSENSRDAYQCVLAYGVSQKDTSLLERLYEYVAGHNWVSGEGPLSRTFWTPTIRALYARAIHSLGGKAYANRLFPVEYPAGATGYAAHLQVVGILSYGNFSGAVTDAMLERLREHHAREPRNPLFAAAAYRYTGEEAAREAAISALSDEQLFPAERLPSSADRCEPFLVQRDSDSDGWKPCPEEGKTHSGGDFLWAEAVLSGRF